MKTYCKVPTPIVDAPLKKLVRRLKQEFKPTHARVRYDAAVGQWAVLNDNNTPIRHFIRGHMTKVSFSIQQARVPVGCGSRTDIVGIAEGELVENASAPSTEGLRNLRFAETFVNDAGEKLDSAEVVAFAPNRHAQYK